MKASLNFSTVKRFVGLCLLGVPASAVLSLCASSSLAMFWTVLPFIYGFLICGAAGFLLIVSTEDGK